MFLQWDKNSFPQKWTNTLFERLSCHYKKEMCWFVIHIYQISYTPRYQEFSMSILMNIHVLQLITFHSLLLTSAPTDHLPHPTLQSYKQSLHRTVYWSITQLTINIRLYLPKKLNNTEILSKKNFKLVIFTMELQTNPYIDVWHYDIWHSGSIANSVLEI